MKTSYVSCLCTLGRPTEWTLNLAALITIKILLWRYGIREFAKSIHDKVMKQLAQLKFVNSYIYIYTYISIALIPPDLSCVLYAGSLRFPALCPTVDRFSLGKLEHFLQCASGKGAATGKKILKTETL